MLPSGWRERLAVTAPNPTILCTVNVHGLDPSDDRHHLAAQGGSYRFGTDALHVVHTASSRTLPFWPLIREWPTVVLAFKPEERRAEIAETTVEIIDGMDCTRAFLAGGGTLAATARLDIALPGLDLARTKPLSAGRVTKVQASARTGALSFTILDGDPEWPVQYPDGPLTRLDFPDAPDVVVDIESRTTIMGPFPERVPCRQIDRDRRRFYLCDPPATIAPNRVYKGGELLQGGYIIQTSSSPTGMQYTEIVFDQAIDEIALGITDEISASGGMGITAVNAITFLLDKAGVTVAPHARQMLTAMDHDFPLSVLVNAQGACLDIVRNRLIPQTPFAFFMHRNRVELLRLGDQTGQWRLSNGGGLLFSLAEETDTSFDSIANAIEVLCGRDAFGSQAGPVPLVRIYRDATRGSARIRELLTRSEALYRRRHMVVEANDLAVDLNADGTVIGSVSGAVLADLLARLHALVHRRFTYVARWDIGLALALNDRVLLTDAEQGIADVPTRVVQLRYAATGPEVTLQTEDAGRA